MKKAKVVSHLEKLPDWKLAAGGKAIRRDYALKNFLACVELIRKIAARAEAMQHHPDLHLTDYKKLRIVLSTHDAGGLSLKDFRLAAEIEGLPKKIGG